MKKAFLAAALASAAFGCSEKPTLYVYTWSDYISPEYLAAFERENGCRVSVSTFDSNEAMYAKLKAGAAGYDIVMPSSYQVAQLVKEGMLRPVDKALLPNVARHFDHSFDGQILDPGLNWSVPYAVTYTGFMCDASRVGGAESLKDLLANDAFRGKITWLDDMREVIGLGLMYNGHSVNSESAAEIDEAVETVLSWKKNVRKFDAESYKTEVANGSVWIGHGYSSDTCQAMIGEQGELRDDIRFVLPSEGFVIAWDEFAIMKGSRNVELAHRFIDGLYDPEVACENMQYIGAPMANAEGIAALPELYRKMLIFPRETLERGQLLRSFSREETADLYNGAWDRIKAMSR